MRSLTACLALVLLGLTACAEAESPSGLKSAADQSAAKPQSPGAAPSRAPSAAPESEMQPVSLQTAGGAQAAAEAFERKIIRNADITVELENPEGAKQRLSSIAESSGGFIVTSESQQRGDSGMHITVTMRVPAAQFGPAVDSIRSMGGRILQDKVTGQDVTEEYIDLQARIRTKQALEAQFLEIMKQAMSISDALEVQRQIAVVRTEIEQLEGRRSFLENQ